MLLSFDPTSVIRMVSLAVIGMIALMVALWFVQLTFKNAGVANLGWVCGIVMIAGIYFINADGYLPRQLLLLMMVSVWSLRLGSLFLSRLLQNKGEDPRYQKIRQRWAKALGLKFFLFFQWQGFLAVVLSTPFLLICLNRQAPILLIEWFAFIIFLVAVIVETLADDQLRVFNSNPANRSKTCRSGLWNYSRHPNYFFEWVTWVSFCVFALGSPLGWVSIVCPALMLYFLLQVSGVPLSEERAIQSRGEDYREYQRTTSVFVPWFKKK